ncbi:MAG TPA: maleylacetate reductase [Steroidobacteraceae bacterium]|nr:maleylacetate reductase [Steroidobacteraceae bacterium]
MTLPPIITDAAVFSGNECLLHHGQFTEVIFGTGAAARLAGHIDAIGTRSVILATPGQSKTAERIGVALGGRVVGVFADAVTHSPVAVSDRVADAVRRVKADLLVSFGGGSAIGLGKAVSLRTGLKHIAVPTTYSGSELTPILGETAAGMKRTQRDNKLRPALVLYDPALSYGVRRDASLASGMNALAHAVEAMYMSEDETILRVASAAIEHLRIALPLIHAASTDPAARCRALYGAWLAAFCLADTPMALHHKLCHTLGGAYDLPHGQTHAVLLPHSLAYNAPAVPRGYDALRRLLSDLNPDPAQALFALVDGLGLPPSLSALGLPQSGINRVRRLACENAYANPRPIEPAALGRLLTRAWMGAAPDLEVHRHA